MLMFASPATQSWPANLRMMSIKRSKSWKKDKEIIQSSFLLSSSVEEKGFFQKRNSKVGSSLLSSRLVKSRIIHAVWQDQPHECLHIVMMFIMTRTKCQQSIAQWDTFHTFTACVCLWLLIPVYQIQETENYSFEILKTKLGQLVSKLKLTLEQSIILQLEMCSNSNFLSLMKLIFDEM